MYDSSDDDDDFELVELEGEENFDIWECSAIGILRMLGLEGFIRGTETPPLGNTPEDMRALYGFNARKDHAWRLVHRSVLRLVQRKALLVPGCGTWDLPNDFDAKTLWDGVQRWYKDIGPTEKLDFLRELTSIDYRQFDDIDAFLNRAQWLRRRLERADMPIPDEMMKTCLYGGVFPQHPSELLTNLIVRRYHDWDSQKMISDIRGFRHDIQREVDRHQQEQQEINRRRNANRHSSGRGGSSRQHGRHY